MTWTVDPGWPRGEPVTDPDTATLLQSNARYGLTVRQSVRMHLMDDRPGE